ncbi:MAG: ISAzo13-like element transposase-related protein [Vicinamibacterales bacterium]
MVALFEAAGEGFALPSFAIVSLGSLPCGRRDDQHTQGGHGKSADHCFHTHRFPLERRARTLDLLKKTIIERSPDLFQIKTPSAAPVAAKKGIASQAALGAFKCGKTWRPAGEPDAVSVYDFPHLGKGKAIPYGTYDVAGDRALVNVGVSHDTADHGPALPAPHEQVEQDRASALLLHQHELQPLISFETVVSLIGTTLTVTGSGARASVLRRRLSRDGDQRHAER